MLQSLFKRYIDFVEKHPFSVIGLFILICAICWLPISNIRLDADLDDLLPRNTPTIKAMKESNQRFGSADLFTIAIQMDDVVEIAKVQDEIKAHIEKNWEDALYVQVDRDNSFFVKHALLYLPTHHLEHIVDNLVDLQKEIGKEKNPFAIDLESELDDGEKKERVWFDATITQELGLPDEAASAFEKFLKPAEADKNKPKEEKWDPKQNIPDSLKTRLIGYHPDATMNGVVQAALKFPSSDTKYVEKVLKRTEAMLTPIRERYGDKIDVGVEGSYQSLEEVESLANNAMVSLGISVVLVIIVIVSFFRSLGALFAILLQVLITCLFTCGFTGVVYGRLNMYTAFVFAILLGMGIDYSIHIMGHAQKTAKKGKSWNEAFVHTFEALFHPIILAAITTIAGMLTLLAAEFVGFYEFGVIASVGISFSVITALTLLPAFVFAFEKLKNIPVLSIISIPTKPTKSLFRTGQSQTWGKSLNIIAGIILVGSVLLATQVPKAGFEYDFKNLRDTHKGPSSNRHTGVAISSNRKSSQPVVALANKPETIETLHDTLVHRLTVDKDTLLRSFLTLKTFVPPEDEQEERIDVIDQIGELIGARVFDKAEGDDKQMIDKLRDMVQVEPFEDQDIPAWALRLVQERDKTHGKIGFIYGSYKSSHALEAAKFQDNYGHFTLNGEEVKLYSSGFIYADIIRLVSSDSKKMALWISIIIILTLALTLKSVKLFFVSVLALAGGVLWTVGVMGLMDSKLGPFNLIVIPTILGTSVDSVIHLVMAFRRYGKEKVGEVFSNTGVLVIASVVTTVAGYAGMLFTTHQGIGTIGELAVIGFACCLIVALFMTPWLCLKLKVK